MAEAIICDRCGKVYPRTNTRSRQYSLMKKVNPNPMRDIDAVQMDICDECYLKLINFIREGEKK